MLKKYYLKTGNICRTTFKLSSQVNAATVALCGEFNNWDLENKQLKQLKDGSFSITVSLSLGRSYRFRYLLDGERWENDWEADAYVPNLHGSEDSIVNV